MLLSARVRSLQNILVQTRGRQPQNRNAFKNPQRIPRVAGATAAKAEAATASGTTRFNSRLCHDARKRIERVRKHEGRRYIIYCGQTTIYHREHIQTRTKRASRIQYTNAIARVYTTQFVNVIRKCTMPGHTKNTPRPTAWLCANVAAVARCYIANLGHPLGVRGNCNIFILCYNPRHTQCTSDYTQMCFFPYESRNSRPTLLSHVPACTQQF